MTDTLTPTTTVATALVLSIATDARNARADYLRANKAWKDAEADALDAFIGYEVTTLTVPNAAGGIDRITAEGMDEVRRSVNMDAALSLLNASQLAAIVTQAIAVGAIDAAVAAGFIHAAVAAQIITTKQVKPSLKVTFNAKPEVVK